MKVLRIILIQILVNLGVVLVIAELSSLFLFKNLKFAGVPKV